MAIEKDNTAGMHELDVISAIHAQLIDKATWSSNASAIHTPNSVCDSEEGGHTNRDC